MMIEFSENFYQSAKESISNVIERLEAEVKRIKMILCIENEDEKVEDTLASILQFLTRHQERVEKMRKARATKLA